jgi:hypothetical protein
MRLNFICQELEEAFPQLAPMWRSSENLFCLSQSAFPHSGWQQANVVQRRNHALILRASILHSPSCDLSFDPVVTP